MRDGRSVSAAAVALAAAVACLALPAAGGAQPAGAGLPACDPDNGGLALPAGFCALVVADGLGRVRHLDVTADGDIYVRNRGARGSATGDADEGVIALRDADGDGRAEIIGASPTTTGRVSSSTAAISTSRRSWRSCGIR